MHKGRSWESLADYVREVRNEKGYSLATVSTRSGGRIGKTHINRIENGYTTNPSPMMLSALAQGLGVLEEEIFAVARGKSLADPNAVEQKLLIKFRELSEATQEDVLNIIDTLHRAHSVKEGQGAAKEKGIPVITAKTERTKGRDKKQSNGR